MLHIDRKLTKSARNRDEIMNEMMKKSMGGGSNGNNQYSKMG